MPKPLDNLVLRAFGGGELAPSLSARADLSLYQMGLRTCRNFTIQRHGGVANRTGTKFVAAVKTGQPWLLKYVFNASQTYVMEFGSGYVRFFRNGQRVTVGSVPAWDSGESYIPGDVVSLAGTNYLAILESTNETPPNEAFWYPLEDDIFELPTVFEDNLELLRATQDKNVVTLTHKDYPPHELVNLGTDQSWSLTQIDTGPNVFPPDGLVGTPGPAGATVRSYQITSIDEETGEESEPSESITLEDVDEGSPDDPHILEWDIVTEASEYRIYCDAHQNGTFGYIGTATDVTTFYDTGFAPDYTRTPPIIRELFWATLDFPHTAAYYQQRRVFANTHNDVGTVWASQTGYPSNFGIHSPLQDDDSVTFTPAGRQVLGIQHLIGLKRLVMLTDGGEWIVLGGDDGVLTPSTIHPEQEGHAGSAAAPVPVVLGRDVIFTQYLSRVVRLLRFTQDYSGFEPFDLTIYAGHLFKHTVVRMDAQVIPHSIVWCVRDDGILLGLTYIPESEIFGWHQHDTEGGLFLDVCVVPEGEEHVVYALVQRTIDGDTVIYLERFDERLQYSDVNLEDAFFVDCGITYDGASTTTIDGLDHLEGEEVMALADGLTQGPFTVASGEIELTTAASVVQVGLPITAQLKTLPMDVGGTGLRDKRKRVQSLMALVEQSVAGWYAGPDAQHLLVVRREPYQTGTDLVDEGPLEINLTSRFDEAGQVLIEHTNPTPLSILGLIPQFTVGG